MLQSDSAMEKKGAAGDTEEAGFPTRWSSQTFCTLSPELSPLSLLQTLRADRVDGHETYTSVSFQMLPRAWHVHP